MPGSGARGEGTSGAERGGKKKLIVAFQFQFANQAGWKCDACRASGLEKKRRCGWLATGAAAGTSIVWARGQTATETCPKSFITAQSITWVEEFLVRRRLGGLRVEELDARTAEAFLILERELTLERNHGQSDTGVDPRGISRG